MMLLNSRILHESGEAGGDSLDLTFSLSLPTLRDRETGEDLGGVNIFSCRPLSQEGKAMNRFEGK